jgi:hypothetical protein
VKKRDFPKGAFFMNQARTKSIVAGALLALMVTLSWGCVPYTYYDRDYRYDRYGSYDRYDRDRDWRRDRYYDRDDWRYDRYSDTRYRDRFDR